MINVWNLPTAAAVWSAHCCPPLHTVMFIERFSAFNIACTMPNALNAAYQIELTTHQVPSRASHMPLKTS